MSQETTIATIRKAFDAGNIPAAEMLCRNVLESEPSNIVALNYLGMISYQIGMSAKALEYFAASIEITPNQVAERLSKAILAEGVVADPKFDQPRFLLIKSWGYGFWADICHVMGALLLAEITDRIPVVHWGSNSLYRSPGVVNAFTEFFEPVSYASIEEVVAAAKSPVFPVKWNDKNLLEDNVNKFDGPSSRAAALYFLNRPEDVAVSDFFFSILEVMPWIPVSHPMFGRSLDELYRYIFSKYFRLVPRVQFAVDEFYYAQLSDAPFFALHLRGTDKGLEQGETALKSMNQNLIARLAEINTPKIFLLTDDERLASTVSHIFGPRVIMTPSTRSASEVGLHYSAGQRGTELGFEILLDTFVALRAEGFAGNGWTNVSCMIEMLRDWHPGACELVPRSQLRIRNWVIYTIPQSSSLA